MIIGKKRLIESRTVSNGSTAENFAGVFLLGYPVVTVEVNGLDESGANIALRFLNTSGTIQSASNYRGMYFRATNTNNTFYVQGSNGTTDRAYDFLWKGGNNATMVFYNCDASDYSFAQSEDMQFNGQSTWMYQSDTSMGGFQLYNNSGGNFNNATAQINVYGMDVS
jgi:outer membrane lipoprotein-sorting protein